MVEVNVSYPAGDVLLADKSISEKNNLDPHTKIVYTAGHQVYDKTALRRFDDRS